MSTGVLETALEFCALDVVTVGVCSAIAWPLARYRHVFPLLGLLAFIAAESVILTIPVLLHWNVGHWNWTGKVASIGFSLIVARLCLSADEVGLRLPRSKPEIVWTVLGIVVAALGALPSEWFARSQPPGLETYAFEATLPGIDEELAFRGVGLALLIRAFSAGAIDRQAQMLASCVTALWFAAVHVFNIQHGHFAMSWYRLVDTLPYGIWFVVIRLKSGSLLGGVIGHNATNTFQEVLGAYGV